MGNPARESGGPATAGLTVKYYEQDLRKLPDLAGLEPKAAALPADGFRLVAPLGAGDVYVIGQSPGGAVAGVGRLLRAIRFGEGRAPGA